jgi:hypothetical protein
MRIHPLSTGTVSVKHSFLFAGTGIRRQLDIFLPDEWSGPCPIHCWVIEHEGRMLLIDTGESAAVKNVPFARFSVNPEQELPGAFAGAGLFVPSHDPESAARLAGAVTVEAPSVTDGA